MALKKTINLPEGFSAEYWRMMPARIDPEARECSAMIALYVSQAVTAPVRGRVAKLRLSGAQYDAWVSKAALVAAAGQGRDLYAQLYLAARAVCQNPSGEGHIVCDFGNTEAGCTLFADAEDV